MPDSGTGSGVREAASSGAPEAPAPDRFHARFRLAALLVGLGLSLLLVARTQVGGDQLALLAHGWLLADRGELVPYGNPLSGGGFGPGPATSILVGAPLRLWPHHRAPVLFIWLTHLAAWALLVSRLRKILSAGELTALSLVYWVNPWRITASAVLWNPNFLFLVGAIHFATALDQRERPRAWSSFAHVVVLGIAVQLHPSVLLLIVLSLLLAARGAVKVHWPAAFAGGVAALSTLVPWVLHARAHPEILPGEEGFLFRAAALVQPWIKGLSYWLRYPSFMLPEESARVDFSAALGAGTDRWLAPSFVALVALLGAATAILAVIANRAFVRARGAASLLGRGVVDPRLFLERYVAGAFAAAILVVAASPTTPQSWQLVPIFHAATIPVALWLGHRLGCPANRVRALARRGALAALAVSILLTVGVGFGARNFRCGGRNAMVYPLLHDSPMLGALGIHRTCPWPTNVPGAGWPPDMPISEEP